MPDGGAAAPTSVEAPSGKGATDENFPVGSFLIAPPLRPTVKAYYDFARATDDIADDPGLLSEDKLHRLSGFRDAVHGTNADPDFQLGHRVRDALTAASVPLERASDLLIAFSQDAVKNRYDDWEDLLGYCRNSANPVGLFLLDLHGEDSSGHRASDALCTALQILNHLQDLKKDLQKIDRSYLPGDWLTEEGLTAECVLETAASPGLRRVIDKCLLATWPLIEEARSLPSQLRSRRLAAESAVIVRLATRLWRLLKDNDPIAGRVKLSKFDFAVAGIGGAMEGLTGPRPKRRS